jgi:hypothetical protein
MKTIGKYKVQYPCGIVQEKDLVRHEDFKNIIQPINKRIYELDCVPKDDPKKEEAKAEANKLRGELYGMFGDSWFTDQSPLFDASKTGELILPEHQGGIKKVKVELT